MILLLLACITDSNPCTDYCDYICDCHAGEADFDCENCYTVYGGTDASTQDECQTSLADQKSQDEQEGHTCGSTGDSGAG